MEKVFSPSVKGVLSGSRFYEVEIDGQTVSLEEPLTAIESQASPILARLVQNQKLAELAKKDRFNVLLFVQCNSLALDVNDAVAAGLLGGRKD